MDRQTMEMILNKRNIDFDFDLDDHGLKTLIINDNNFKILNILTKIQMINICVECNDHGFNINISNITYKVYYLIYLNN